MSDLQTKTPLAGSRDANGSGPD